MMQARSLVQPYITDPTVMAGLVLAYQRRHNLDDAALQAHLGLTTLGLVRLAQARRPLGSRRIQSVITLAAELGISAALLWGILQTPLERAVPVAGRRVSA